MNLTELLRETNVPFMMAGEHHHVSHGWAGTDCPFCSPGSGRFRLGIRLDDLRCSCWSCGWHPTLPTLAEVTGLPWGQLKELLEGLDTPQREETARGKLVLPYGLGPLLPAHQDYLAIRGIDPEQASEVWGCRGIGIAPRLQWRVWIPAMSQGKTSSWTTRSISENPRLRYISAKPSEEAAGLKTLLLGEEHCRHAILVVEGPLDAMALGPGAASTCGLTITKDQVNKIAKYPVRVICLDNEPVAQRVARKLCRALGAFPGQTFNIVLESGKDPSRTSKRELKELRRFLT